MEHGTAHQLGLLFYFHNRHRCDHLDYTGAGETYRLNAIQVFRS